VQKEPHPVLGFGSTTGEIDDLWHSIPEPDEPDQMMIEHLNAHKLINSDRNNL